MSKTLQEQFVAGLIARGLHEVKRTHKFIIFNNPEGGFYYVGSHGSLRFGQNVASSIPVRQAFKNGLLGIKSISSVS